MIPISIPNRPFATELLTGAMLPDGFFESSLAFQKINSYFRNDGLAPINNLRISFESASSPGIRVTALTHSVDTLEPGAARLLAWDIDVSGAPVGKHFVSFIAESPAGRTRRIVRIFVTRVRYDASTGSYVVSAPEGELSVRILEGIRPADEPEAKEVFPDDFLDQARFQQFKAREYLGTIKPYTGFLLPTHVSFTLRPVPYSGQYGDLPYQDPWWKVLGFIALIVAALVAVVLGIINGLMGGAPVGIPGVGPCASIACSSTPLGVVAGIHWILAFAGGIALAADSRDPFRRGQDHTLPGAGEVTISESVELKGEYLEPVALGRPFKVKAQWNYKRVTRSAAGATREYGFEAEDLNENVHVLSRYEVTAPDVAKAGKKEPFIVRASFYDKDEKLVSGAQLFVRCILVGLRDDVRGQVRSFILQDDAVSPDERANDGIYTGQYFFMDTERGFWQIYVIAQDVNHAQPSMDPETAAQIIGGLVVTHQTEITFRGGTCPNVPDGQVRVD